MQLKFRNIQLVQETDSQKFLGKKQKIAEWQNFSERNWYPPNMPVQMSFWIQHEGKIAGGIELTNIRWFNRKAEITIWIEPDFRHKGLARKALEGIINLAFNQLNFHRLEAEVYDFNLAARNLFNKVGFVQEGALRQAKYMDGKYCDIIRFGLLKPEWIKKKS